MAIAKMLEHTQISERRACRLVGLSRDAWRHVKVRYRGLDKNTAQLQTLFALANLWMVLRRLTGGLT